MKGNKRTAITFVGHFRLEIILSRAPRSNKERRENVVSFHEASFDTNDLRLPCGDGSKKGDSEKGSALMLD